MIPQSNPKANYLANRPAIDAAIARVLDSGWYILGQEVKEFEQEFAAAMGADWSVGVANGTDAIEIGLRALGVGPGDSVLTVSHTAVATVSAISRIGARPLFVDIDPERYTMSPLSLADAVATPQGRGAKAMIVVHLYGQSADMPALLAIADPAGIPVIEDCAQAHGASLGSRPVGTWGKLGCFSFYPTKNLGALGDGGGIVGQDRNLEERVRLLREYGWRSRYISEGFGLNSRLDEIQAAILRVKLSSLAEENRRRQAIAHHYDQALAGMSLRLPTRFAQVNHVYHQYVIQTERRDELKAALQGKGVGSLIHYPLAVHQQPAYADPALRLVPLCHTEAAVPRILSLPMFPELTDDQVSAVVAAMGQCAGIQEREQG